jgi:hypothetical protein
LGEQVRSSVELEAHARAVAGLLGRRLAQCRRVFLAGADFLHRPIAESGACLEAVARVLPLAPASDRPRKPSERPVDEVELKGIDVALDTPCPPLPDRDGWALLRDRGLGRVTLTVASGDPEVRLGHGQAWTDAELAAFTADRGPTPLNVLLLVGAGGRARADAHVAASARLLNSLALAKGDIVYLVEAADLGAVPGEPLSEPALEAQRAALKGELAPLGERGVKVLGYSREKEWN